MVTLNLECTGIVEFSGVLYSKYFSDTCLLSVSQLASKGVSIAFERDLVQLKLKGKLVALGTLCKSTGLYKLSQKNARVYKSTVPQDEDSLQL